MIGLPPERVIGFTGMRTSIPELVLDLSELKHLPAHLPRRLSSLQFPHRSADAYLRDARLDGQDFIKTKLGRDIFGATAQSCGPLMAWFPQALLYGFWQSHLGKKAHNTKHARVWVSEVIGWQPATTDTRVLGLKGDPLNLTAGEAVTSNPNDRTKWSVGKGERVEGGKNDKLSEIGHGQVPFMGADATAAPMSFARVTQRATVSFAQLRRISLGGDVSDEADTAARALLVALGLHAHQLAFGRGFSLRSGADLRRVRLFFVDGFFAYSWAFLLADDHFSVRFARGQRPGQRPPASFGRPARPDHGARTLRSSPPPPWTFARRFDTVPWEGRCLCDGRSSDDAVLGTYLLGRVGCHQRSRSHGPTLPPCR